MKLIKILSSDDPQYDQIVCAPEGMSAQDAADLVTKLIRELKEERPEEYQFEDLVDKLEPLGFTWPSLTDADEAW